MITDQAEMLRVVTRKGYTAAPKEIRPGKSRIIAVTSGKGGVGKTNLVLNLALKLSQMNCRVVVFDADLGLGNLDILINAVPEYTLEDVISGERDILEIMVNGPCNLKIIPGGSGLFDLANLDLVRRRRLLDRLQVLEKEGEIIFLDTSAGISRNVLDFIKVADEFIVVTTPEPVALTDAYGMLKVIAGQQINQTGYIVVNFTRHVQQGEMIFQRLQKIVQNFQLGLNLQYLGNISYDPAVSRAVEDFSPFLLSYPESAATASISKIAWRLLSNQGFQPPPAPGRPGFIERIKLMFLQ